MPAIVPLYDDAAPAERLDVATFGFTESLLN